MENGPICTTALFESLLELNDETNRLDILDIAIAMKIEYCHLGTE